MGSEQEARAEIDRLLTAAGWRVQDPKAANILAAQGVAIREFEFKDESLEDSDNPPAHEVIAQEMIEDLEGALEQLRAIAGALDDRKNAA